MTKYLYIQYSIINKYSIFVKKNVLSTKHYVFTIPKGVQGNLKLLSYAWGSENLITLIPSTFLFVNKDEHLILVFLCKSDQEHKEVCASD